VVAVVACLAEIDDAVAARRAAVERAAVAVDVVAVVARLAGLEHAVAAIGADADLVAPGQGEALEPLRAHAAAGALHGVGAETAGRRERARR
jgi:hypothetical protein